MPRLRHSLTFFTDYRLGYGPQRPYPWRWTTPLALFILLASAAVLTCLNIPLSAYETVQEFTYFPNATVAALPMGNMIPSFLHSPTTTFAPQTLNVGQTFRLNNSIFSYTIASAFDATDNKKPVSSFPYYNNPFSGSCDVTNITATVTRSLGESSVPYQYYTFKVSGFVTCTRPTLFQMTWSHDDLLGNQIFGDSQFVPLTLIEMFGWDLKVALWFGVLGGFADNPYGTGEVEVHVRPCCNCTGINGTMSDAAIEAESANLVQRPCSTEPARFMPLHVHIGNNTAIKNPWGWNPDVGAGSNITDLFAGMDPHAQQGYIGSGNLSALNTQFQNLFQVSYHIVRYDLGIILENQIYNSPGMFNKSITPVVYPQDLVNISGSPFGLITPPVANTMRVATSNETLMAQWQDSILAVNGTDRVPVLQYLQPVPRLKPLGTAITSVFVSTFAMVSTVWTIFSIVARTFVRSPDSNTVILRERLNEAKWGFEETETTEASSLTEVYKDSSHVDDRLNILSEQNTTLMKRMDQIENNLRNMKRGTVHEW